MKGRKPHLNTEPTTTPPPEPPDWLTGHAKAAWVTLAEDLHARGILHALDAGSMAGYCSAFATYRQAEADLVDAPLVVETKQGRLPNPLLGIRDRALTMMNRLGAELGLSPVARRRLQKDSVGDEAPSLFKIEAERRARGA